MQSTVAILCALEAFHDGGILVKFLLLDFHIYSNDILPDDTPGANVQVSARGSAFIEKPRSGSGSYQFTRLPSYP